MTDQKEYLSKERYDELVKELDHLKKVKRKEVAEDLEYAKALGDLSENAEYHEARDNQAAVEDRINRLEAIISHAEIVELHHTEAVGIGSTVTVQQEGAKGAHKFQVVGSEEANIALGKISLHSPIGEAMAGKRKGETFSFLSPKGKMTYKIVDIA